MGMHLFVTAANAAGLGCTRPFRALTGAALFLVRSPTTLTLNPLATVPPVVCQLWG
jgi:hypothetical protein